MARNVNGHRLCDQQSGGQDDGSGYTQYSPLTYPLSLVAAAIGHLQHELEQRRASGEATRDLVLLLPFIYSGYRWLADLKAQEGGDAA